MAKRPRKMRHEEEVFWESDGVSINIEDTQFVRQARMEERGESKPEFVAPGAEQMESAKPSGHSLGAYCDKDSF
jgi:hypothetical protein